MLLVVGLGNPGERYARTRHNVAWWVLDRIAAGSTSAHEERDALFVARTVNLVPAPVVLLKPLTYMNRSGEALAEWRRRHGLETRELMVVTDDVYLPVGAIRLRGEGSAGGHRGLESLESVLGSREYARLRIGVGQARDAAALREHVLEGFAPEEAPVVDEAVRLATQAITVWAGEGLTAAMNQYNRRVRKEDSET